MEVRLTKKAWILSCMTLMIAALLFFLPQTILADSAPDMAVTAADSASTSNISDDSLSDEVVESSPAGDEPDALAENLEETIPLTENEQGIGEVGTQKSADTTESTSNNPASDGLKKPAATKTDQLEKRCRRI